MFALAVSALVAAYLLIPYAEFRYFLGRFVPLRVLDDRKTEDLTRAVVTLGAIFALAVVFVRDMPICKEHPFWVPNDSPTLRAADYEMVASGLYSDAVFKENRQAFWDALMRVLSRQGRFALWYYALVLLASLLGGFLCSRYGQFRSNRIYRWAADLYLLPHISQWHAILTPFTFPDRRTVVRADVLMSDGTLYSGAVAGHFLDNDGKLSGLFLDKPKRFDRAALLRERESWATNRSAQKFWRDIPSAKLYLVGDHIVNLNLSYEPPYVIPAALQRFLQAIQKQTVSVSVTSGRRK